MRRPSFLRKVKTLVVRRANGAIHSLSAVVPSSGSVPLNMQVQKRSLWCWAAVSASVSVALDAASTWQQCSVANKAIGRADCCAAGDCNQIGYLDTALSVVDCYDSKQVGVTRFNQIKEQIGRGLPVGCRIYWRTLDMGHFVAISGWTESGSSQYLNVADPARGTTTPVAFDAFCTAYMNDGEWTHSYYLKHPGGGGA
ncbi:MAG: hypothetical protein JOZ72_08545 [Alphaproteobacteria bacterium]|nr:hypothetical protein [Alphaproteobacteria bacterium]